MSKYNSLMPANPRMLNKVFPQPLRGAYSSLGDGLGEDGFERQVDIDPAKYVPVKDYDAAFVEAHLGVCVDS